MAATSPTRKKTLRNFYSCTECETQWEDSWDCAVDDDCPHCGTRHVSPYESQDIPEDEQESMPFDPDLDTLEAEDDDEDDEGGDLDEHAPAALDAISQTLQQYGETYGITNVGQDGDNHDCSVVFDFKGQTFLIGSSDLIPIVS